MGMLLDHEADPEVVSQEGCAPLQIACQRMHLHVADILLRGGANINSARLEGQSALYNAAVAGHLQVTRLLLERRAETKMLTLSKRSPLHAACLHGHKELVALLLRSQMSPEGIDGQDLTPLSI